MSHKTRRFGDYQRLLTAVSNEISLNAFNPKIERDAEGRIIPVTETRIKLNTVEAVRLLQPYVSVRFMQQVKAVVPLALYLALFQILFLAPDALQLLDVVLDHEPVARAQDCGTNEYRAENPEPARPGFNIADIDIAQIRQCHYPDSSVAAAPAVALSASGSGFFSAD